MIFIVVDWISTWQNNLTNTIPTFMNIKVNNFDSIFLHFSIKIVCFNLFIILNSRWFIRIIWLNIFFYNPICIIHFFGIIWLPPSFESCYRYIDSILCTIFDKLYKMLNILSELLMFINFFLHIVIELIISPKVDKEYFLWFKLFNKTW